LQAKRPSFAVICRARSILYPVFAIAPYDGCMNALWRKILSTIALALILSPFAATPAPAQSAVVGTPIRTCIAPARADQSIDDVLNGRIALDCVRKQTDFGQGDFWVVSEPLAIPAVRDGIAPRLRFSSLWQQRMTLYLLHEDGHLDTIVADSRQLSRHIELGAIAEFPLPHRDAGIERLVWKIEGSANRRGVLNGARIATAEQSTSAELGMATLYSLFAGLCIALIVYNLALWGALRHPFQLAYCLMVALLLLYALSSSGLLAWVWPGIDNNDRLRINYFTLSAAAAAALLFARKFFEPAVFAHGLGRLVDGVAILLVGVGAGFALLSNWWVREFDLAYSLAFVALLLVVPVFMWRAWRVGSRYLWLFGIAWAAPVVTACLRVMHSLNLLSWGFWLDNSTIVAMATEALLSSLAIAYRIRLLSHERDLAIEQEVESRRLAETDPLTGLLNRRAFLEQAIGRRGDQQLLLIDIDHFKAVNETIGHDGGDEVLRVFARQLALLGMSSALVARLGGEEFALLLDHDARLDPGMVLARLRATPMPFDLRVTASLGACTGPLASEIDWKHLYRSADRALFDAKRHGRDRAHVAEALAAAA
jgi:diguanylate cyclase (GGDEF)-like protein